MIFVIVIAVGEIYFNDINLDRSYSPMKAYAQTKLANILFTKELAHRLKGKRIEIAVTCV